MASRNGITPVSEIRRARAEGFSQTLPESGYTVRVRPLSPERLLALGDIPNPLLADIERMLFGGADGDPFSDALDSIANAAEENFDAARQADTAAFVAYINRVCCAALVAPRMALENPGEDEIEPEDLPLGDRFWLYKLCTQPIEVLRSFRLQENADVEGGSDGETLRAEAEQPAGNSQPVGGILPG